MGRRERQSHPHVVMIPFPGQGQVTPLMRLAHWVSDHGIKVTFVNSDFIHAKVVAALPDQAAAAGPGRIGLVSIPDGLDPEDDRKDFTRLLESLDRVMSGHLKSLIENINGSELDDEDDDHITCIIFDIELEQWPMKVAESMGIQWVPFCPCGPQNFAWAHHIPKLIEKGILNNTDGSPLNDEMICISKDIPMMSGNRLPWSWPSDLSVQEGNFQFYLMLNEIVGLSKWILCNSFDELDSSLYEMIPNILPIGPLHASKHPGHSSGNFWTKDSTCISWLDQQPDGSVIYAAFGSITTLSQHQFSELAHGLELAGRPFLWVVRSDFADGSAADKYPDGFMERVVADEHGKIVSWAPQEEVLAHPSVACFISHCGWNSTMDGIANGVPFLCWPGFTDQFLNQSYICKKWKVGLELNPDENGFISRHEIKEKIENLVSDEGIKENAEKLQEMAEKSVSEGGSSTKNFKTFIQAITH